MNLSKIKDLKDRVEKSNPKDFENKNQIQSLYGEMGLLDKPAKVLGLCIKTNKVLNGFKVYPEFRYTVILNVLTKMITLKRTLHRDEIDNIVGVYDTEDKIN